MIRVLLASIITIFCGGCWCAYNGSPIHAGLTQPELGRRVAARWPLGMSPPDTAATARRAGLDSQVGREHGETEITDASRRVFAWIFNPGLRWVSAEPGDVPSGTIEFDFSEDAGLEQIVFERHSETPVTLLARPEPTP